MMEEADGLDAGQRQILIDGPQFMTACPGGGKTRALVSRYRIRKPDENRGKALLSFTNRAVDECLDRLRREPTLLTTPNFIGTFDNFIQRFLVSPWMLAQGFSTPTVVESLAHLPNAPVVRSKMPGRGIGLWKFEFGGYGTSTVIEERLSYEEKAYLRQHQTPALLESIAARLQRQLIRGSQMDCAMARSIAMHILLTEEGTGYLYRLESRFSELLVDELQDCDSTEISILEMIANSNVNVVGVADFDQSIYAFRGADLSRSRAFRDNYPAASKSYLRTNYRSTSDICRLLTSLSSDGEIYSSSEDESSDGGIFVFEGPVEFGMSAFANKLAETGHSIEESVVLTRKNATILQLSGDTLEQSSNSFTDLLVEDFLVIRSPFSRPRQKQRALRNVEARVVGLTNSNLDPSWPLSTRPHYIGKQMIDLRDICASLFQALSGSSSRETLGSNIRGILNELIGDAISPDVNLSHKVRSPTEAAWYKLNRSAQPTQKLKMSTIHSAKGAEWDAVLLCVDDSRALRSWILHEETEEKRVLYVGVSRARRLLAFSVESGTSDILVEALHKFQIPFVHLLSD